MAKAKGQLEKVIERSIFEYLATLKHTFAWKNHSVGIWDSKRNIYRKPVTKYNINGASDIICLILYRGINISLFLEVKTATGRQSKSQKIFEDMINYTGGNYYIVRSIDDVIDAIGESKKKIDKIMENESMKHIDMREI